MGEAISGQTLSEQELRTRAKEIRIKSHRATLLHLLPWASQLSTSHRPSNTPIISAGIEIEALLVDHNGNPLPAFAQVQESLNGQAHLVTPELFKCHAEVSTQQDDLFSLATSRTDLSHHLQRLLEPLHTATTTLGIDMLLIGGHPCFEAEPMKGMLSPHPRYQALIDILDPRAKPVTLQFVDGSTSKATGFYWEGISASIQVTLKVEPSLALYVHDAYTSLCPLLLALSASSPFIMGKDTPHDSNRYLLLPGSVHGHEDQTRPGRWRALRSLTSNVGPSRWADQELYQTLQRQRIPDGIAQYWAEVAGDGPVLITPDDFAGEAVKFPRASAWNVFSSTSDLWCGISFSQNRA